MAATRFPRLGGSRPPPTIRCSVEDLLADPGQYQQQPVRVTGVLQSDDTGGYTLRGESKELPLQFREPAEDAWDYDALAGEEISVHGWLQPAQEWYLEAGAPLSAERC